MARNDPQGEIKVTDPTCTEKHKDYRVSDIEHVMGIRAWTSWKEIADWLRREGDRDNELTPGEAGHMAEDMERLAHQGEKFTNDPHAVYVRAHGSR